MRTPRSPWPTSTRPRPRSGTETPANAPRRVKQHERPSATREARTRPTTTRSRHGPPRGTIAGMPGRVRRLPAAALTTSELVAIRALMDVAFANEGEDGWFGDDDWEHALGGTHFVLD